LCRTRRSRSTRRARAITVPEVSTELPPSARARERERARARRGRPRRRWLVWIVRIAAAALVFFAGLAIGRALGTGSDTGETNTSVRTLVPSTLTPQQTVTVTVSNP
jgi:anti-sigma factor RsiW